MRIIHLLLYVLLASYASVVDSPASSSSDVPFLPFLPAWRPETSFPFLNLFGLKARALPVSHVRDRPANWSIPTLNPIGKTPWTDDVDVLVISKPNSLKDWSSGFCIAFFSLLAIISFQTGMAYTSPNFAGKTTLPWRSTLAAITRALKIFIKAFDLDRISFAEIFSLVQETAEDTQILERWGLSSRIDLRLAAFAVFLVGIGIFIGVRIGTRLEPHPPAHSPCCQCTGHQIAPSAVAAVGIVEDQGRQTERNPDAQTALHNVSSFDNILSNSLLGPQAPLTLTPKQDLEEDDREAAVASIASTPFALNALEIGVKSTAHPSILHRMALAVTPSSTSRILPPSTPPQTSGATTFPPLTPTQGHSEDEILQQTALRLFKRFQKTPSVARFNPSAFNDDPFLAKSTQKIGCGDPFILGPTTSPQVALTTFVKQELDRTAASARAAISPFGTEGEAVEPKLTVLQLARFFNERANQNDGKEKGKEKAMAAEELVTLGHVRAVVESWVDGDLSAVRVQGELVSGMVVPPGYQCEEWSP
ncbi:hypothetical protein C8R43DRAFT_682280 [Mycena crocata]|nr:hypothetical protein C8R43DRAFT_682280 [Mycena crocata]